MARLEDIPMEDLWQLLDEVEKSVPTQRILAAIAAKQGEDTGRLAERHQVSPQTTRNWLSRFETRPIEAAPFDEPRTGRQRKLSQEEHGQLLEELQDSPEKVGFDRQSWFPRLVYHHLESEYGVHYSLRHLRRLLREAGVTWRTARPTRSEGDPEEVAEVQDTLNTTNAN
jgi:transposase